MLNAPGRWQVDQLSVQRELRERYLPHASLAAVRTSHAKGNCGSGLPCAE